MCIPYMRRRAESLRQVVMDVTPNGVLIITIGGGARDVTVAETMLGCSRPRGGKPLSNIMRR